MVVRLFGAERLGRPASAALGRNERAMSRRGVTTKKNMKPEVRHRAVSITSAPRLSSQLPAGLGSVKGVVGVGGACVDPEARPGGEGGKATCRAAAAAVPINVPGAAGRSGRVTLGWDASATADGACDGVGWLAGRG
jgi:hypothetical protein